MSDRTRQTLTTSDGRTLCFAEWGPADGTPLFNLHGTPGGRLNRHPDPDRAYGSLGSRVITYDRPGYGGSDRLPGRSVVDCVSDVAAIADHLGLGKFAVTGGSGGGPHTLAVAARLADRVVRASAVVCPVPYDAAEIDFLDGMDPGNIEEFGWALAGEDVVASRLSDELAAMGERVKVDPSSLLGDGFHVDESDLTVLRREDVGRVIRESTSDLVAGGHWGWVDDDLAFTRPWGFDVREIAVPVEIRYGRKDVLVPAAHGDWLATHVPNARVVVDEDSGHMSDPDRAVTEMRWVAQGLG
jgi:pimeloyl-ACP methyl ester carboxylesterase